MAQHDYDIANADGATVRADLNSLFEAIASENSGATAPAVTFRFMLWFDTSTNLLKRRNSNNTDWITIASLAAGVWIPYRDGSALPGPGTAVGDLLQLVGVGSPAVAGLPAVDASQITGLDADQSSYDNAASGLAATDVQAALDEVASGVTGGMTLIASATASADASVDFTGISGTYDVHVLEIVQALPATDAVIPFIRFSQNNGVSWVSSASAYRYCALYQADNGATLVGISSGGDTEIQLLTNNQGNLADEHLSGRITFYGLADGGEVYCTYQIAYTNSGGVGGYIYGSGKFQLNTSAVDGVQFAFTSGNVASGKFYLYGMSKS